MMMHAHMSDEEIMIARGHHLAEHHSLAPPSAFTKGPRFSEMSHTASDPPSPRRPPPELIRTPQPKPERMLKDPFPWEAGGGGKPSADRPDRFRTLQFDMNVRAKNLAISHDHTSVSYRGSGYGGFVLTQQPLKRKHYGRFFEIVVEEVDATRWRDGLGIGLASKSNAKDRALQPDVLANLEGYACEILPESWLIGYDGRAKLKGLSRYLRGKELPGGMWRATDLRPGDIISFLATPEGHMVFFHNANPVYYVTNTDIPWMATLHGVVDLDGCTKSIHVLDGTAITKEVENAMLRLKEHDPLFRPPRPESPGLQGRSPSPSTLSPQSGLSPQRDLSPQRGRGSMIALRHALG